MFHNDFYGFGRGIYNGGEFINQIPQSNHTFNQFPCGNTTPYNTGNWNVGNQPFGFNNFQYNTGTPFHTGYGMFPNNFPYQFNNNFGQFNPYHNFYGNVPFNGSFFQGHVPTQTLGNHPFTPFQFNNNNNNTGGFNPFNCR